MRVNHPRPTFQLVSLEKLITTAVSSIASNFYTGSSGPKYLGRTLRADQTGIARSTMLKGLLSQIVIRSPRVYRDTLPMHSN